MADLKTIIQITQDQLKKQVPTHQAVMAALDTLRSREADVITRRAGLRNGEPETLQTIGAEYGITRERVRQIEQQGIKKFRAGLKKAPLSDILRLALDLMRDRGGVISQDRLVEEFLPESQQTPTGRLALVFLLEQSEAVVTESESKTTRALYGLTAGHVAAAQALSPLLVAALAPNHQPKRAAELFGAVSKQAALADHAHRVTEAFVDSTMEIGKVFVTAGDRWGLAEWPEINPKNIREKTLYMLRKIGTPLHFKDITEEIRNAKLDQKKVTTQAVHNELINGDEFVLIGRGIYALRQWGYLPGTVSDVIGQLLKQADGPLERDEVMAQVLKQRHVSKNTILINLQDKSKFDRVGKHAYTVAGPNKPAKPIRRSPGAGGE